MVHFVLEWTNTEIVELLQPLLRNYEKDQGLSIDNVEQEPGSKIGDNYMSIVVRTIVTGKRGDGAPYSATFMTKRFPRHRQIVGLIRNADLFFNEAHTYMKLLPRLGSTGPRCVFADVNDIIMEDLRVQGYVVCERRNLLDLPHCEATVKTLAALHGRSLVLKLNSPEEFDRLMEPLKEAVFPLDDEPSLGKSIDSSLILGVKYLTSIEDSSDEIKEIIEYLKSLEGHCYDLLRDIVKRRKDKYHVLSHGDAWNNNIVFKHDNNGRVTDVKLLDYQIVRHASPAIDFHYFVYSSARSSVIEGSYDHLIKTYQAALVEEMKRLGVTENVLRDLSVEWFKSELKKTCLYGLLTSFWLVNAVLAEEGDTIDMDTLTPDFMQTLAEMEVPIRASRVDRVKCITLHYKRTYL